MEATIALDGSDDFHFCYSINPDIMGAVDRICQGDQMHVTNSYAVGVGERHGNRPSVKSLVSVLIAMMNETVQGIERGSLCIRTVSSFVIDQPAIK